MRILVANSCERFAGRMLNIHPSLLPRHRGLHTHQRVLEAGDAEHGASVHFVTAELDGGPVVLQARVPVRADDDEATLLPAFMPQEHRIYPQCIGWYADGPPAFPRRRGVLDGRVLEAPLVVEDPMKWQPEISAAPWRPLRARWRRLAADRATAQTRRPTAAIHGPLPGALARASTAARSRLDCAPARKPASGCTTAGLPEPARPRRRSVPQARERSVMQVTPTGVRPLEFDFNDGSDGAAKDVRLDVRLEAPARHRHGRRRALWTSTCRPALQDTARVQIAMMRRTARRPQAARASAILDRTTAQANTATGTRARATS